LAGSGASLAVIIAGSFAGYLTGAWLTDALGRRRQILLFAIGGFATVLAYTRLDIPAAALVWLGLPLGFFPSGIFSGVGALLSELFPTAIRASGQGFCYNAGRGLGALVPWLIGLLADRLGLGEAVGLFAAGSYLLVLLSIAFLPETRGIALPD
jgi:fucose permease